MSLHVRLPVVFAAADDESTDWVVMSKTMETARSENAPPDFYISDK